MLRNDWSAAAHSERPAGRKGECFYCGALLGDQHRDKCVIRSRTVVVRTVVEHVIDVPEEWDKSIIEFTEGSSCSDNIIDGLASLKERLDKNGSCTCGLISRKFLREATEGDEDESALFVAALPS